MKCLILILFCLSSISCAVTANREGDKLILKGWGAKSAEWTADGGAKISKEEPIRTPDLMPTR